MNVIVHPRTRQTKGMLNRRRRQGLIPSVIFGRGMTPVLVETPAKAIADVLTSEGGLNTVLNVKIAGGGGTHRAMMCELVRDPITRDFLSIGLHHVEKGE